MGRRDRHVANVDLIKHANVNNERILRTLPLSIGLRSQKANVRIRLMVRSRRSSRSPLLYAFVEAPSAVCTRLVSILNPLRNNERVFLSLLRDMLVNRMLTGQLLLLSREYAHRLLPLLLHWTHGCVHLTQLIVNH